MAKVNEGVEKAISLVLPKKSSVLGTVVKTVFKEGSDLPDSKFKRDTFIITLSLLEGRTILDVFVSSKQWDSYALKDIFYNQNVVNVTVEEHIAGITGYPGETGELIPANFSGKYFVNAVEGDTISVSVALAAAGAADVAGIILDSLAKTRHNHKVESVQTSKAIIIPEE